MMVHTKACKQPLVVEQALASVLEQPMVEHNIEQIGKRWGKVRQMAAVKQWPSSEDILAHMVLVVELAFQQVHKVQLVHMVLLVPSFQELQGSQLVLLVPLLLEYQVLPSLVPRPPYHIQLQHHKALLLHHIHLQEHKALLLHHIHLQEHRALLELQAC